MAGKPEPPQNHIQHHQQQPNVQNVVVYVSNDNFAAQAYATAVNQQNVTASYPQQQTQQNGGTGVTFTSSTQSVAPLGAPVKSIKPPLIKTQDFPTSNGLIGNVSVPQQASFYASTNTPGGLVQTNGFHHSHGSNVINNIAYSNNNVGHSGAILNQGFGSGTSVKSLVNLGGHPNIGQQQAVCPSSVELSSAVIGNSNEQLCNGYSVVPQPAQSLLQQQQQHQQQRVAVTCAQTFFSGPDQKNNTHNEVGGNSSSASQALAATNFIAATQGGDAANVVAVMGCDGGTAGSSTPSSGTVVFPRCDSVRSETAESSCSSLSSADSQPDAGTNSLTLLLPPSAAASHHVTPVNNPHLVTSGNSSLVHQNPTAVPPGLNNATGMVMLNNGVNVQQSGPQTAGIVRTPSAAISLSQQQLGNIVLAMAVPPNTAALNNNSLIQPAAPSVPVQPVVPTITVPFGWKRLHVNGAIVYISPSNTALSSLDHLKEYLQTQGTCKCGLECPLRCDTVFSFDPKVATRPWVMPPSDSTVTSGDLTKLCNHKRKLLAMAALAAGPGFNSQQQQQVHGTQGSGDMQLPKAKKDGRGATRKKRKVSGASGFSGVSVSQLLAQREQNLAAGTPPQVKEPAGRAPQSWSGGPSSAGTIQHLPTSGPQLPNRAHFPPPNFTSDTNVIQGVNTSPQLLRYTTPNGGVTSAILGGNIMVHPNTSPVHLSNLTQQQQQNLIGVAGNTQPVMRLQPGNPVLEQPNTQSSSSSVNPHQGGIVTTGNAAILSSNAVNPTVMSSNTTNPLMIGNTGNQVVMSAGGMMVHSGGNPGILCQPQQRVPPLSSTPDEIHNASGGAISSNSKALQQQQHVMYSGVINSSGSNQNPQDLHMLRMQQQQQQFYGQPQSPYHVPQPRLEDQNKVLMQQQQSSAVQNARQLQQHHQFVSVPCSSGVSITGPGNVFVDQYNRGQQITGSLPQQQQPQQQQHQSILQMQQQHHHQMLSSGSAGGAGIMMMHQQRAPPWQQQNRNNASSIGTGATMMAVSQPQSNALPPPSTYDRVPPLHHHTPPPPVWTEEVSRKKPKGSGKTGSANRKQRSYSTLDHHQHHRVGIAGIQGSGGPTPMDSHAPCPNIDVRQIPIEHNRPPPSHPNNSDSSNPNYVAGTNPNVPSFMEDPSGYLAQQTALLNSTISRQTGVGGPNFLCHSPVRNPITPDQQVPSPQNVAVNLPTSCSSPTTVGVPLPSNVLLPTPKVTPGFTSRTNSNIPVPQPNLNVHASVSNPVTITSHHSIGSPIPAASVAMSSYTQPQNQGSAVLNVGIPDSSVLPEHRMEVGNHCQGCGVSSASLLPVSSSGGGSGDNILFHHQMQHQIQPIIQPEHTNLNPVNQRVHQQQSQQQHNMSSEFKHFHVQLNSGGSPNDTVVQQNSNSGTPTPNIVQEESPVTSSTFDRLGNAVPQRHQVSMTSDSRGPIQGGTVSTSNGSPLETYSLPQPEASPTSSTPTSSQNCRVPDTSSTSNIYISSSSSSPFTVPNVSPPGLYSYSNTSQVHFQAPRSENMVACSSPGIPSSPVMRHPNRPGDNYCHYVHDQTRGQKFTIQSSTVVTTMASGHTVSSNTITSVLAGKANTATVSVGNPSAPAANTPPTSLIPLQPQPAPPVYTSQAAMMTIPQPSSSVPAVHSQGMHVATVSKSPLEMVQSVVSSIQVPPHQQQQNMMGTGNGVQAPQQQQQQQQATAILKSPGAPPGLPPGHILVSSGGQLIMTNAGNVMTPPGPTAGLMAPPPQPPPPHSMAKLVSHSSMPPMSVSPMVTSVTAAVTQVIPAVGVAQQVLGQPTVLVNALPAPLLIQPSMMTVDGMTGLNQNAMQIPHLAVATGNVIHHSQGPNSAGNGIGQLLDTINQEHPGSRNSQTTSGYMRHTPQQTSLLSPPEISHHSSPTPGSGKKKGGSKKRKVSPQTVASMLHIASQQNSSAAAATATATGIVMQQQQQQNFPQQSFTMSGPHQSITTTGPMLQALTIVPGKAGAPAQILMNGQPGTTTGHFGTQQLIAASAASQPPQQINLLQPVNLLNGAAGVVQNFPTFQQFIVPSLGGMVMATDGTTTLLPDATNLGVQLQLQNVNGQNVLTPVQSHGGTAVFGHPTGQSILAAGPAGMVIRTPTTGGKMATGPMLQQQNGGAPQFLTSSANGGQFLVNGTAAFGGQLSPLVANVSPNQQMSFTANSSPVRPATGTHQSQQEFVQCGQMGQTLMVPCTASTTQNHQNTTVVQQNTTIVQQQTTMVSNNQQLVTTPQNFPSSNTSNSVASATTLNVNQQNFIVGSSTAQCVQDKIQPSPVQQGSSSASSSPPPSRQASQPPLMMKHSVSTQTAVNQSVQVSSSPSVTPGSLVVTTNNTFCQTLTAASSGGSPPDTTTHSPIDAGGGGNSSGGSSDGHSLTPSADTTTHSTGVGSTDDGLSSPSPSSCPVTGSCGTVNANGESLLGRQQSSSGVTVSPMPMVHCVSSSNEQDTSGLGDQTEYDWGVSSGKGMFVSPTLTEGGFSSNASSPRQTDYPGKYVGTDVMMSVTGMGHMICESERQKSVGNMYVESSTVAALSSFSGSGSGELLSKQQQEAVVSSRQLFEYSNSDERRVMPRSSVNSKLCSSSSNVELVTAVAERGAKRKHSDALVVMETHPHDIHSMEEDDEENVAEEGSGALSEGDLVWGAARGFPAWPGKLVGPVTDGDKVWVRWFGGDRALTQVPLQSLKTLSEGLEAHHRARKKFRKSRKLNSQLENAIQEAMLELDRMTEQQQSAAAGTASAAVSNEPTGRLRRSTHR